MYGSVCSICDGIKTEYKLIHLVAYGESEETRYENQIFVNRTQNLFCRWSGTKAEDFSKYLKQWEKRMLGTSIIFKETNSWAQIEVEHWKNLSTWWYNIKSFAGKIKPIKKKKSLKFLRMISQYHLLQFNLPDIDFLILFSQGRNCLGQEE